MVEANDRGDYLAHAVDVAVTIDSGFYAYLDTLEITPQALGSFVLDVGSGKHERFAKQAALMGIRVVSMTPGYVHRDVRESARTNQKLLFSPPSNKRLVWQGRSVAGLAQELPFPDETFDTVLSVRAVTMHMPFVQEGMQQVRDRAALARSLSEIHRVLRRGGKSFLGPITKEYLPIYDRILDENAISSQYIIGKESSDPNVEEEYKRSYTLMMMK